MPETRIILKSILRQVKKAKSLKEAEHAIRTLMSKEDIAVVEEELAEEENETAETK